MGKLTEQEKLERRRNHEGFLYEKVEDDIVFKRMPLKKQKKYKKKVRMSSIDYNFLQYVPLIRSWAMRNYDLTLAELDMLMYLYPVNIFTPTQFNQSMKEIGRSDYALFTKMKKNGWFKAWSESGNKKYYAFSHKASELITRYHRMCALEEEIPMSERRNVIVRSQKKSDKNLTELFKIFNQKVKDNV